MNVITTLTNILEKIPQLNSFTKDALCHDITVLCTKETKTIWIENYPIALVRTSQKICNKSLIKVMETAGFFSEKNETVTLSKMTFNSVNTEGEKCFQKVDFALFTNMANTDVISFKAKRNNDFWRRVISMDNSLGIVSFQMLQREEVRTETIQNELDNSKNGQWKVESSLRDGIRSKKESSALREIPFIWVMVIENKDSDTYHIKALLAHYFQKRVRRVESESYISYIGWAEKLSDINMRYFYKKSL